MDLVFEEEGGWVIVDFKTDPMNSKGVRPLAEKYGPQLLEYERAWQETTGEPVKEKGLYFTELENYIPL